MTPFRFSFSPFRYLRDLYARFERPISSLSLIGGFVFDALTLRRVDEFWENVWVVGHILIVGACMVWINRIEHVGGDETNPKTAHFWLVNVLQFFFGGILSTFLVFYFRSGDLSVSWPFLLILALAFWANEALKRRYVRLSFQISLFFLSLFSFSIFITPVLVHRIGPWVFIGAGVASLALILLFLFLLTRIAHETFQQKFKKSGKIILAEIALIFVGMNVLYFTNLIPPLPLSLKDGGVYHSIRHQGDNYFGLAENLTWWQRLYVYTPFHVVDGDSAYVYTAVFSPPALNLTIIHEWQLYDALNKRWITQSRIPLPVIGGRESGFRTYSVQSNLSPGKWRVNVETQQGQVIGRVRFEIVPGAVTQVDRTIN